MDAAPVSIARRLVEAAQHFIPRCAERIANAANHVDSRIGRASFDALDVAPVDFRQARQIVLSQSALRAQAVDVFSENGARRLTHLRTVRRHASCESGRIVAFSDLCPTPFRSRIPSRLANATRKLR